MSDVEYREELAQLVMNASRVADWIYHDVRLDCDAEAQKRTAERLKIINSEHGADVVFGIAGWWAVKSYMRLQDAHRIAQFDRRPEFRPVNLDDIKESNQPEAQKRAHVSALQFISTMTHGNEPTARAIFDVAYEAGVDEFVQMMYSVLIISIRNSSIAYSIKDQVHAAQSQASE